MEGWGPRLSYATLWRPAYSQCMWLLETLPSLFLSNRFLFPLENVSSVILQFAHHQCPRREIRIQLPISSQNSIWRFHGLREKCAELAFHHCLLITFAFLCLLCQVSHSKAWSWAKNAPLTCAGISATADSQQTVLMAQVKGTLRGMHPVTSQYSWSSNKY